MSARQSLMVDPEVHRFKREAQVKVSKMGAISCTGRERLAFPFAS